MAPKTYIYEYPHPRAIVHYHPVAGEQLALEHIQFALRRAVHAIELDLHYREDGHVVANHDDATAESPTLGQAMECILQHANGDTTLNHDDRQFFLVLDLKDNDIRLFRGVVRVLSDYAPYLSTAVNPGDPPRGMTVVITGDYVQCFYAQVGASQRDRLCIVEGCDYSEAIGNLSEDQIPFQWAEAFQHDHERGRVNALHAAADPLLRGRYNLRVWDCQNGEALSLALASGADAVNADRDQVELLEQLIGRQVPRGAYPTLSIQGARALAAWRGAASNELYMALGTLDAAGLHFPRQIGLTSFLEQSPLALVPSVALCPDQRLLIVYQEPDCQRLWYISGKFTSADRFLTFDGRPRRLASTNLGSIHGRSPAVAVGRDGRIMVVYEGAADGSIWYISGFLNTAGELVGQEYRLSEGQAPAIAIGPQRRVFITYAGSDGETLGYVAGTLDRSGKIAGRACSFSTEATRRGYASSAAWAASNQVLVACQGTDAETLWYVYGTLGVDGRIAGQALALAEGTARHPSIARGGNGDIVLLYTRPSDQKLCYIHGRLDPSGRLVGRERMLDVGMDRH